LNFEEEAFTNFCCCNAIKIVGFVFGVDDCVDSSRRSGWFFKQNWNLVISRCEIKKQKSSFFCKIEIWIIIIVIFLEEQGNFR
jgi:hypothetical protein